MTKARQTTTARGLGWRHQQQREALLRRHVDGTPCWWCGKPMLKKQGLAADHTNPRAQGGRVADRLLHSGCNSERGDGRNDHLRPALTGRAMVQANHDDLGRLAMPWPA